MQDRIPMYLVGTGRVRFFDAERSKEPPSIFSHGKGIVLRGKSQVQTGKRRLAAASQSGTSRRKQPGISGKNRRADKKLNILDLFFHFRTFFNAQLTLTL
jgi:hypothetical protein